MSLTAASNRLSLACRAYDAAALNPPLDTPDPTANERVELRKALAAFLRDLPWEVLDAVIGADDWPPVEATDGPPPVAEAVIVTEDDGEIE